MQIADVISLLFVGAICGGITVGAITGHMLRKMKKHAVEKGFAYWHIIDNAAGLTQFRWKEGGPKC
jgi:NhaP-type Na+/H+ or K+/H+ antiporter